MVPVVSALSEYFTKSQIWWQLTTKLEAVWPTKEGKLWCVSHKSTAVHFIPSGICWLLPLNCEMRIRLAKFLRLDVFILKKLQVSITCQFMHSIPKLIQTSRLWFNIKSKVFNSTSSIPWFIWCAKNTVKCCRTKSIACSGVSHTHTNNRFF